jgi:hypothetical protein
MQVDLSEAAARILSELEEAGAENFSSTVNTITERSEPCQVLSLMKSCIKCG